MSTATAALWAGAVILQTAVTPRLLTRWTDTPTPRWAIAAAAAALYAGALTIPTTQAQPAAAALTAIGIPLALADLRTHRLPNPLVGAGAALALAHATAHTAATHSPTTLLTAIGCALATTIGWTLLAATAGIGPGDVKTAAMTTLWLAALSPTAALTATLLTALLGGAHAAALLLRGANPNTALPYGPAILLAGWATTLTL